MNIITIFRGQIVALPHVFKCVKLKIPSSPLYNEIDSPFSNRHLTRLIKVLYTKSMN